VLVECLVQSLEDWGEGKAALAGFFCKFNQGVVKFFYGLFGVGWGDPDYPPVVFVLV
jgi:hypothetical protein